MGEDADRVQKERGREEEKEGGREGRRKEGGRREGKVGGRTGDTAVTMDTQYSAGYVH